MFSDHVQKISGFPQINLLGVAGGLVIVCQLVAMALVVDGQVQRAGARDLQRVAQQLAFADCIERSTGLTRSGCTQQVQSAQDATEYSASEPSSERLFSIRNVITVGTLSKNEVSGLAPLGLAAAR